MPKSHPSKEAADENRSIRKNERLTARPGGGLFLCPPWPQEAGAGNLYANLPGNKKKDPGVLFPGALVCGLKIELSAGQRYFYAVQNRDDVVSDFRKNQQINGGFFDLPLRQLSVFQKSGIWAFRII